MLPKDINLNLMVEMPRIQRSQAAIVVDDHSKMDRFILCHTTYDEGKVVKLDFEVVKLHGISTSMVKYRESKSFIVNGLFWKKLMKFSKGVYDDFKAFKKRACNLLRRSKANKRVDAHNTYGKVSYKKKVKLRREGPYDHLQVI